MSAQAFNRISALEKQMRELIERVNALESKQAREAERPHTLSLKPKKAETSHA